MKSSAIANSNIALVKYWGRSPHHDPSLNIPLNDTVSMTQKGMNKNIHLQSHTTIDFSEAYKQDTAVLNGKNLYGLGMDRVLRVVNSLRECANTSHKFKMISRNDFPTRAGMASSASGFAALSLAAAHALNLRLTKQKLSTYARLGSGSAARSVYGGFVYWHKGSSHHTSYAEQICSPNEFEMNCIVAIIHEGQKEITSDKGHESAHTSPLNDARVKKSQQQAKTIRKAILDDDFTKVGRIAEENCKYMHVVMMTSQPPLFYWHPNTLRLIKSIPAIRNKGLEWYFTIDAGPNVVCLCRPEHVFELRKVIEKTGYAKRTIVAKPANEPFITEQHLF